MKNKKLLLLIACATTITLGTVVAVSALGYQQDMLARAGETEIYYHYARVEPTETKHGSEEFWVSCSSHGFRLDEPEIEGITILEGVDFSTTKYFEELQPSDSRYIAPLGVPLDLREKTFVGVGIQESDYVYRDTLIESLRSSEFTFNSDGTFYAASDKTTNFVSVPYAYMQEEGVYEQDGFSVSLTATRVKIDTSPWSILPSESQMEISAVLEGNNLVIETTAINELHEPVTIHEIFALKNLEEITYAELLAAYNGKQEAPYTNFDYYLGTSDEVSENVIVMKHGHENLIDSAWVLDAENSDEGMTEVSENVIFNDEAMTMYGVVPPNTEVHFYKWAGQYIFVQHQEQAPEYILDSIIVLDQYFHASKFVSLLNGNPANKIYVNWHTDWQEITIEEYKTLFNAKEAAPYNHVEYARRSNDDPVFYRAVAEKVESVWTYDEDKTEIAAPDREGLPVVLDPVQIEMLITYMPEATASFYKCGDFYKYEFEYTMDHRYYACAITDKYFCALQGCSSVDNANDVEIYLMWSVK